MDVSALGFKILVKDTKIFPSGFTISRTADGTDPFGFNTVTLGEATVDANGHIVYAATPNSTEITLNLLPNSEEDNNMSLLFESHRPRPGVARTGGKITITIMYADGKSITANNCYFLTGDPKRSVQAPSRYKNKVYTFACEDYE